jgi:hypothetical protein
LPSFTGILYRKLHFFNHKDKDFRQTASATLPLDMIELKVDFKAKEDVS